MGLVRQLVLLVVTLTASLIYILSSWIKVFLHSSPSSFFSPFPTQLAFLFVFVLPFLFSLFLFCVVFALLCFSNAFVSSVLMLSFVAV